jgi:hypothetical protein
VSDPYAVIDLVVGLLQCPGAGAAANCDGLLDACRGKGFANLRDEAIIRLYCNTGARLSEVGNLRVADLDLTSNDGRHAGGRPSFNTSHLGAVDGVYGRFSGTPAREEDQGLLGGACRFKRVCDDRQADVAG